MCEMMYVCVLLKSIPTPTEKLKCVDLQCILNTAFIMSICRNAIVAITTENQVRGGGRFFSIHQIQIIICLQQVIVEAIAIKV